MNRLKREFKEFMDKIDLNKKYPRYFNKWILRGVFIIIAVIYIFALGSNGWSQYSAYAQCPEESSKPCKNPFYPCESGEVDCMQNHESDLCIGDLCTIKYLSPGQMVGERPSWLMSNFNFLAFVLILLAFVVNHMNYSWRKQQ